MSLDANRSIWNGPHILFISSNTSECKDHSVELLIFLDSALASTLIEPGMRQALSQITLSRHYSQICLATLLQSVDFITPITFTYATVAALSD